MAVSQDASRIRGSHGRPPDAPEEHGVLVTSFPVTGFERGASDRDVYALAADRLGIGRPAAGHRNDTTP
jgi:hypothetical protein